MAAIIGDWLAHRAELSPERVALIDVTRSPEAPREWTYRAWNAQVNRTAHALRELGVGKGDRVAVLARNCVEYLDLWFACGKLGAVLQALNWRLSAPELTALVDDGGPQVLVYGPEYAALAGALEGVPRRVGLARDPGRPEAPSLGALTRRAASDPPPRVEIDWDDPWVICYTGGTTGLPKGAILTHRSVTWNAINTVSSWGLSAREVAILNAPLFHTGGLNVFTAPLVHAGGTSIVCAGFDPDQVLELIRARGVTVMFGVPTMFLDLLARPGVEQAGLERLSLVISGGAPCPAPVFERMWSMGARFKTGYGLTEAGPNNFWLPNSQLREKPGAVGYPLMHVELKIVAEQEGEEEPRELGPDAVGELWLRGPHLFAGYWNNPAATAEAVTADGWLRTGDLARRDAGGCVTIVGRSKDMFISGGENIYPAEIESVLAGHPEVAAVAVIGVPHPRWGEVGRAIVVREGEGAGLDEAGLLEYAGARLARYKLPKSVVFVDALPRTGAGKVDKRALRERYAATRG